MAVIADGYLWTESPPKYRMCEKVASSDDWLAWEEFYVRGRVR